jgi:hypothetical protein
MEFATWIVEGLMAQGDPQLIRGTGTPGQRPDEPEPTQPDLFPERLSIPAASDIERHVSGGVWNRRSPAPPSDGEPDER